MVKNPSAEAALLRSQFFQKNLSKKLSRQKGVGGAVWAI